MDVTSVEVLKFSVVFDGNPFRCGDKRLKSLASLTDVRETLVAHRMSLRMGQVPQQHTPRQHREAFGKTTQHY